MGNLELTNMRREFWGAMLNGIVDKDVVVIWGEEIVAIGTFRSTGHQLRWKIDGCDLGIHPAMVESVNINTFAVPGYGKGEYDIHIHVTGMLD